MFDLSINAQSNLLLCTHQSLLTCHLPLSSHEPKTGGVPPPLEGITTHMDMKQSCLVEQIALQTGFQDKQGQ